ncbi:CCKAR [Mytilus edulis]|uniref:CCKAR n=1 Tax=Mytilus edulis TaxID=6550 RepID=A0A8S3V8T2_MYTED|nr:CCKAR [Mytilus edulis]
MENISSIEISKFNKDETILNVSWKTLHELNNEETIRRVVPIVYLTILTLIGIPGNLLILYIYLAKFQKKAVHRTFVTTLALVDLFVCCVAIPFEIVQMAHEYIFYSEILCKFGRTAKSLLTLLSALVLVALSMNRFRRICQPLKKQLTCQQTLKCMGYMFFFAVLFSSAELLLSGIRLHDLEHNLIGHDCSLSKEYINTIYLLVYSTVQLILYIICMVSLIIMCFLIGRQILQHIKFRDQFRLTRLVFSKRRNRTSMSTATCIAGVNRESDPVNHSSNANKYRRRSSSSTKKRSPTKITRTAFTVSLCFIFVYFPYIVIGVLDATTEGDIIPNSDVASAVMPLLYRSHFINNVVNFIIFVRMDTAFRKQCREISTDLFSLFFKRK